MRKLFTLISLVMSLTSLSMCLWSPHNVRAMTPHAPRADDTTIVYVKDNKELRLIQPDGSNDRLIWQFPDGASGGIMSVAWRPDGQQIAFTSSHEATCSEFDADIYLINPDGSNLHRLTNAPGCSLLAAYPQGSASVQVENRLTNVNQVLVYIEGAPTAKVVSLPPGSTTTVVFAQVADLGAGVQQNAVVINGNTRWFDAAVHADIVSGENRHAGKLTLAAEGSKAYGAYHISWNPAGDTLAYQFGQGSLWRVGLDVPILSEGGPLLDPQTNNSILGRAPVWSPISNQFLYEDFGNRPPSIVRAEVGSTDAGTPLAHVVFSSGIAWLSDGSGFVVADDDDLLSHTDLYLMRFENNSITQLTQTAAHEAAAFPKVSADSAQLVYVYVPDVTANPVSYQLRIMNIDGSNDHLLVEGGTRADWSRVAPQNPIATPTPQVTPTPQSGTMSIYLPLLKR
ncbi:MAG: hypothetical protein U0175_37180 [Caldilineaceae bacterium]